VSLDDFWVDRDERRRAWSSVESTGEVRNLEARQRRFDGTVGWFHMNIRAVRDEGGRIAAYEGSAEDVTHRKAVQEALRQRTARLEMLHELDWAILTAEAPEAVAEAALTSIARLIPCHQGSVATVRSGRSAPTVLAAYGLGRAWRGEGPGRWAPPSRHLEALREGRPYVTEESPGGEPGEAHHHLTVPMLFASELTGALSLAMDGAQGFTPEHVEIAREVADPLALAIQQSRLHDEVRTAHAELQRLTARIVEAQEAERRRIARELHDEVGQVLIGLKLSLEGCARLVGETARARLGAAQVLVTDLIGRLRDLSLDLRPPMLDDLGLLPALLWLFERYTANTHVRVTFRHAGIEQRRFAAEAETAVYRIVQEALTNVARHAAVDEAQVQVWTAEGVLHLRVRDHGRGFDLEGVQPARESSGLGGMRERAAVLGGRLAVESRAGSGTLVTAELPAPERIMTERETR
jgi:signal transduction histidine kinase